MNLEEQAQLEIRLEKEKLEQIKLQTANSTPKRAPEKEVMEKVHLEDEIIKKEIENNQKLLKNLEGLPTDKPQWLKDEDVTSCLICKEAFSLLKRRHHCRSCGKIYCSSCCKTKRKIPTLNIEVPQLVCEICLRKYPGLK